jgi:hypothetical protein
MQETPQETLDKLKLSLRGLALSLTVFGLILLNLYCYWQWFAIPVGLPDLSLAHIVGLRILCGLLTAGYLPSKPMNDSIYVFKTCCLVWLTGAFIHYIIL